MFTICHNCSQTSALLIIKIFSGCQSLSGGDLGGRVLLVRWLERKWRGGNQASLRLVTPRYAYLICFIFNQKGIGPLLQSLGCFGRLSRACARRARFSPDCYMAALQAGRGLGMSRTSTRTTTRTNSDGAVWGCRLCPVEGLVVHILPPLLTFVRSFNHKNIFRAQTSAGRRPKPMGDVAVSLCAARGWLRRFGVEEVAFVSNVEGQKNT